MLLWHLESSHKQLIQFWNWKLFELWQLVCCHLLSCGLTPCRYRSDINHFIKYYFCSQFSLFCWVNWMAVKWKRNPIQQKYLSKNPSAKGRVYNMGPRLGSTDSQEQEQDHQWYDNNGFIKQISFELKLVICIKLKMKLNFPFCSNNYVPICFTSLIMSNIYNYSIPV